MSLKESVLLVNLNISQWSARKYDKKVSREVEESHSAYDAGRFNKMLIAVDAVKSIGKVSNKARTFHYVNTLPWGDNGDRILPSQNYFTYIGELGKLKVEFEAKVSEFIANYPSLIEDAKLRLGSMFSGEDYPSIEIIERKFNLTFGFLPIGDVSDIRIDISEDEIKTIKQNITASYESRIQAAEGDILGRIKDAVKHIADTLADKDKIFRDSLVGNIYNLVDLAPTLNFNNNQHIIDVVNMLEPLKVNALDIRNNPELRIEIADKAKEIYKLL